MTERTVVVQLVNLTDGLVYLKDGRSWPITCWLDEFGDLCEQAESPAWFVAGVDGQGYIVEPLADYVRTNLQ